MMKQLLLILVLISFFSLTAKSQQPEEKDTFFLAKKHGIIGRLARTISVEPPGVKPVKLANPYLPYTGAIIRNIELVRLGFERNIYDTNIIKHSFGLGIAKALHKNTKANVIVNDLLFRSGDRLFPNLLADNERLLRDEVYIQDARILVKAIPGTTDSVDVIVITKDVFSLGGSLNITSAKKGIAVLKEENAGGSGTHILASGLYDGGRDPRGGYGAEFTRRNIRGSFIDWTTGFQTYSPAFNSGRNEVTSIYTGFQKPLVTPYIPWTGALNLFYNQTNNNYPDSTYANKYKYSFLDIDGWYGYNFGSKRLLYQNLATRLRKFIAIRAVEQHFTGIPDSFNVYNNNNQLPYDYRYDNVTAVLGAFNIFKQDFYRTNFIYGFGRDEDVPEGFSASVIGGWTNKDSINKNPRVRPYFGFDGQFTHYSKNGLYSNYILRIGAYNYHHNWEDFDILISDSVFTGLKKLDTKWYNRNFFTASITKQISTVLNQPLILQSQFGLPYFPMNTFFGDFRTTITAQSVFYNVNKLLGFRFAPFVFGNATLISPINQPMGESDIFTAVGGGIRTRNENLIFGTIELKAYYFPRTVPGMNGWRIELNSNLQFKFNSTFIKQPDFIIQN
jgi:hypothetical protein